MQDIEKTELVNNLLDQYGELLTEKQSNIMNMYFGFDYSLSEIAENTNTSRAAVYDLIKRTCKILNGYEEKLHLLQKKDKILHLIGSLDEKTKSEIENLL